MALVRLAQELETTQPDLVLNLILCHTRRVEASVVPEITSSEKLTSVPSISKAESGSKQATPEILSTASSASCTVNIISSRPDLANILKSVVDSTQDGGGVGIGACGPSALVTEMDNIGRRVDKADRKRVGGVETHVERFSL
jgi:hypothetical protein